jgi:ATP-dependent 26S proteasome regulatory subunit
MQKSNLIGPDVNFEEIADTLKNYTGAEIKGVCDDAKKFAM